MEKPDSRWLRCSIESSISCYMARFISGPRGRHTQKCSLASREKKRSCRRVVFFNGHRLFILLDGVGNYENE